MGDEPPIPTHDLESNLAGIDGAARPHAGRSTKSERRWCGALTSLTFGDKLAVTMTATMAEADFSGKLNGYEAQIVAAFLPKCQ